MAIEYKFDRDLNCLLLRVFGELTLKQFEQGMDASLKLPGLAAQHLRLTDLRQVAKLPPAKDIYTMARRADTFDDAFPPKRTALVTRSDVAYGVARIFVVLREPDERILGVYRNVFDALDWLELPPSGGDPFAPRNWNKQPFGLIE